jgi:L-methionine (R)-S-oxide reductase
MAGVPTSPKTNWVTRLTAVLLRIGRQFEAVTGTIHVVRAGDILTLVSSFGVPKSLLPVITTIPFGKGIAGTAAQRRKPVTICNIQTDASGITRPGAKSTGVEGAIAVPILDGRKLIGVLGIGKAHAHTYSAAETKQLRQCAKLLVGDLRASEGVKARRRGVRRRVC